MNIHPASGDHFVAIGRTKGEVVAIVLALVAGVFALVENIKRQAALGFDELIQDDVVHLDLQRKKDTGFHGGKQGHRSNRSVCYHEGMSTSPYKNYSQAHEAFLAAWEAMQRLPDAPNEDAIALDGLRAVLPLTTQRKLIHNYRYREVAAVVEAGRREAAKPRSIHGADGQIPQDIEVKTGTLTGKTLSLSTPIGMFDKIHTRVSPSRVWDRTEVETFLATVPNWTEGGFHYDGVPFDSPRRVQTLIKSLVHGLDDIGMPSMIRMDRLTSSPDVRAVHFCVFLSGSVDPLLTVETDIAGIEEKLGEVFDRGAWMYEARQEDRTAKAPSARDSIGLSLGHMVMLGKHGRVTQLDFGQILKHGIEMDDKVVGWLRKNSTPDVRTRVAKWKPEDKKTSTGVPPGSEPRP